MTEVVSYDEKTAKLQQPTIVTSYAQPAAYANPTVVTQTMTTNNSSGMRQAIPALPMPLAIVCLIINIIFPGIGTVIAGFSVLCCGNVGESGASRFGTFCINFWVGWLQLFLACFFFIGWIWSIIWGIAFVTISADDNSNKTTTTTTVIGAPQPLPQVVTYTSTQVQPPV